jgi:hypothetical protein
MHIKCEQVKWPYNECHLWDDVYLPQSHLIYNGANFPEWIKVLIFYCPILLVSSPFFQIIVFPAKNLLEMRKSLSREFALSSAIMQPLSLHLIPLHAFTEHTWAITTFDNMACVR